MADATRQQEHFEKVSEEYADQYEAPGGVMAREKIRRLRTALSMACVEETDSVLNVGVGAGELLARLDGTAARRVGTDFSRSMIDVSRDRAGGSHVQGAVQGLPFADGSFDAVFCLGVVGYLEEEDLDDAVSELVRVVAPGGVLVLTFANARSPFRRFRQFYYYEFLNLMKRLSGLGEITDHEYNTYAPSRVLDAVDASGATVDDRRYLTYSTGLFDARPNVWLYRTLDRALDDSDSLGGLAMTWVLCVRKPVD